MVEQKIGTNAGRRDEIPYGPYQKSILRTTLLALCGYGLFLILTISGAVYYVGKSIQDINTSVLKFDQLSRQLEAVNDYFIRQAKDRKNLLLRGENPQDLETYWERVDHMTVKIKDQMGVVLDNPLAKPYRPDLQQFMQDHEQLMQVYRQGVNIFQRTQDYRTGDQYVRGQGKEVGDELTQVLRQIKDDRQTLVLAQERHIQNFLIFCTIGLILIIVAGSGVLAFIVTNPIRRIIRFTRFLEDSQPDQMGQSLSSPVNQKQSLASHFGQPYHPMEGNQRDEIGYMLITYGKLAGIISDYNQQLQARDALLNCVNAAAQCLVAQDDLAIALPSMLKILGKGTNQCRAYILNIFRDSASHDLIFDLFLEWNSPGTPSKRDTGGRFPVPISHFPERLSEPLKAGQATQFLARELDGIHSSERMPGQARSLVGVPITVAGEWWGLLGLDNCIEERVWSEAEITVLATAATAVGNAIERDQSRAAREAAEKAVLKEREQAACQRAAELAKTNEAIGQTLNALTTKPDLEDLLDQILPQMTEQTGAHATHLFLYHEQTATLQLHLASQEGQVYPGPTPTDPDRFHHPIPTDVSGIWQAIVNSSKPVTFDEHHPDSAALYWPDVMPWHQVQGYRASACARMKVGDQPIGFISFVFRDRTTLTDEQLEFIQALTNQATLAIHLTRLAEQSQASALLDERNRLAREIHDTLAQAFTGVSLQLEAAKGILNLDPELARTYLQRAGMLTRQGLAEARRSVCALRSQALETDELSEALPKTLIEMTRDTSLETQFQLKGASIPLSDDLQLNLLRIGQEAITNTIRHAQARSLSLSLTFTPQQIGLRIVDDGIGFDVKTLTDVAGFGLIGMRERAARFEGTLQVISQPGDGTTIDVALPVS